MNTKKSGGGREIYYLGGDVGSTTVYTSFRNNQIGRIDYVQFIIY